jgi:hypothetical protein
VKANGLVLEVSELGDHILRIADLQGRIVAEFRGKGNARYDMASRIGQRPGLYALQLQTLAGSISQTILLSR